MPAQYSIPYYNTFSFIEQPTSWTYTERIFLIKCILIARIGKNGYVL